MAPAMQTRDGAYASSQTNLDSQSRRTPCRRALVPTSKVALALLVVPSVTTLSAVTMSSSPIVTSPVVTFEVQGRPGTSRWIRRCVRRRGGDGMRRSAAAERCRR